MSYQISPHAKIGHVHLKVSNLERAVTFYKDILGFDIVQYYGKQAAFLSAGGYHHHIGLNTWNSLGTEPVRSPAPGLFHFAILYPTRGELARAYKNLLDNNIFIDGASDHGVSEAIYFRDPDENGIEIYWDRPREEWPKNPQGNIQMKTDPLDLHRLLMELT